MTREEKKRKTPVGWTRGVVHELKNPVESGEARSRELYEIYCRWLRQSWTYNVLMMTVDTEEWLISLRTLRNERVMNPGLMYDTWFPVLWMPEFWYYSDGKPRSLGAMDASWMHWLREDQYPEWAKVEVSTGRKRTVVDDVLVKPVGGVIAPGVSPEVLKKMKPGDKQVQSLGGFYVIREGGLIRLDTPVETIVNPNDLDDEWDDEDPEEEQAKLQQLALNQRLKIEQEDKEWRQKQKELAIAEGKPYIMYQTPEEIAIATQAMMLENQQYWAEEDRRAAEAKAAEKKQKEDDKKKKEDDRLARLAIMDKKRAADAALAEQKAEEKRIANLEKLAKLQAQIDALKSE